MGIQKQKKFIKFTNNLISEDEKKSLMEVILKQEWKIKFDGEVKPIYILKRDEVVTNI